MTFATLPTQTTGADAGTQIDELRRQLTGELFTPSSPGYDDARQVQDITNDARPLAIVRAEGEADVIAAVRLARATGAPLAVRSGGHSLARYSMVDGALVVDLSRMKGIEIDPATRTARVQTGVTSGDLAGPAAEHGLAISTGDTSSVGFGGLTTGGGIGFMVRKYGLTIDNLLSARVVTADGEIVTVSETERPELFWAIRGGGGNFGIVTELELQLAPVPQILGGDLLLPATRETVRGYLEYSASAPDDLTTIGNIMYAPPAPFVPEEWVGKLVLSIIVTWSGDVEAGQQALAPLRALAEPVADTVRPMPYPDIYLSTAHQALPHGFSIRSMFANELSDEVIDSWIVAMEQASSPYSLIHLRGLGGAMDRVAPDATAFAHRGYRFMVSLIAVWLDPSQDPETHRAWVAAAWEKTRHEGSGAYVNFLEQEGAARIADAYPPATLARLRAVKRVWDPENVFRLNQNIAPEE
ncbi:MAG TPA: FAD-binding oxidoreductase [Thermomicrobiales bacterium]|nr:FAD-binding oxidoreductase [Thermomicrobiales bacterium]